MTGIGFLWMVAGFNALLFVVFNGWGNLAVAISLLLLISLRAGVRR